MASKSGAKFTQLSMQGEFPIVFELQTRPDRLYEYVSIELENVCYIEMSESCSNFETEVSNRDENDMQIGFWFLGLGF